MKTELKISLLKSLFVFGAVIEARDAYTGGHVWRVARFAKMLAKKAGVPELEIFKAFIGGVIHDLGKVGVPDNILNKPGKLTDEEFLVMRTHPQTGKKILAAHPLAYLVLDAVSRHHERADGEGYPKGSTAEETPIVAKIITVADAFDAMTSTRPYRKGMKKEQALYILQTHSGSQFNAALVEHITSLNETNELDEIIGHSDEGSPLVGCPKCGPIIAVPRNKHDGDTVCCASCKGKFELHKKADTFDVEFKGEKELTAQPEIDLEQFEEMAIEVARYIEL